MEKRRETSFLKIFGILALYSNILGIDIPLSFLVMESWASWVGYRTEHIHVMQMIRKESRNCFQEFRTLGNSLDLIPNSYCSVLSSRKGSGSSHYACDVFSGVGEFFSISNPWLCSCLFPWLKLRHKHSNEGMSAIPVTCSMIWFPYVHERWCTCSVNTAGQSHTLKSV